ncbi:MAG: DNA mismatch repair endonuclease MutL [Nitrospira sp.]|nr:DNA mismatch repair endonuclease MutL [Nitrospira sp.]
MVTAGSGKIRVLPGDVVSRIAAGEVIERPAAVVKELIENSLDAGSRSITVEIQDGGLTMIRVTDDGEGMEPDDAMLAFERHATSKLRSDRDLWTIRTMGFRGEALPSIAAVSHVRVSTAVRSAELGVSFRVREGKIDGVAEAPPVAGTSIEVRELFYNQPARKKFLKSAPAEFSHISRVVQQAALAWPSVHFRLLHNGAEAVNYPAVSSERDRVGQVYRLSFLDHCRPVQAALPTARVSGYVIDPVQARSSRVPQELFLNRRPVRNAAVFHAVTEGYGASLARGRQPLFVLFLDVDPDRVDVNVHPAKREIRFADQDLIHRLVRRAVRQALGVETGLSVAGAVEVNGGSIRTQSQTWSVHDESGWGRADPTKVGEEEVEASDQPLVRPDIPPQEGSQLVFVSETAEPYVRVPSGEIRPLGQLNRTFLIVQLGGDLAVIDQHTAHERVLFERLFRAWMSRDVRSQPLLLPETVVLPASHAALLSRHQNDLEKLGLELEPFGPSSVLVRAVPVGLGKMDMEPFLLDLLDDLGRWDHASTVEAKVRSILASLACHGAIRSGRSLEPPEIKTLVEDWRAEGEPTTCPHGRRTVFRLGTDDLEKMFGRAGW